MRKRRMREVQAAALPEILRMPSLRKSRNT